MSQVIRQYYLSVKMSGRHARGIIRLYSPQTETTAAAQSGLWSAYESERSSVTPPSTMIHPMAPYMADILPLLLERCFCITLFSSCFSLHSNRFSSSPILVDVDGHTQFLRLITALFDKCGCFGDRFAAYSLYHVLRLVYMLTALKRK
jgi:hypothetical protein